MKLLSVFALALVILTGCSGPNKKKVQSNDQIVVSILPQKSFVEKIAGNDFNITVLVPPGSSPAAYTLAPSQLRDIANSSLWFRIGYIGFEYSWSEKIKQANKNMKVVDLSEGLDLIADKMEHHGDHVHMDGVDPHIWLSPKLVKQMAGKILDELLLLKPEKSAEYKGNYQRFVKEIDQLHVEIKNQLKHYSGKKIIVFHPSLSYYARDYGLEQYSLETGGKEPTPRQMGKVVDLANDEGIKVIYIQSEFDREHARVFAEEIDGQIIQVRPLDPNWSDNLREMTEIFVSNF